ncbi:MAG: hypothetical protein RH917_00255 [Lacipirellulaceae bacterium]
MEALQHPAGISLVQAVEVWLPSEDQSRITWASGSYTGHDEFAQKSKAITFERGEGLPGIAWEKGLPVVSQELSEDDFVRGEAARRIGIDCLVAVPVMQNEQCRGVVSFLCRGGEGLQGAFEVWHRNDRDELGLSSSYYSNLERFGAVSQCVRFPRRAGLPGETWNDREPKIVSRVGLSKSFMRAAGARAENLSVAIAWPIMRTALELEAVFMMLSSAKSPIASVMEVWKPQPKEEEEGNRWCLADSSYGPFIGLEPVSEKLCFGEGEALVGRVAASRTPMVSEDLASEPTRGELFAEYGFTWSLGLPVFVGEELTAIVVMMQ